jgi:glycosyltransferase involved in cell wall biosynthesis
MPKISIITACFNCRQYISNCIKSVQEQKFKNYEHLILDDKSRDNSLEIIKKYAKKDKRIRIIKAESRLRCGSAYQKLSHEAKGEIVCVLDSDDALTSKSMDTIYQAYKKYPDIQYMWTQFHLCDFGLRKLKKGFSHLPPPGMSLLDAGMNGKHCFSHWRTFRRSILGRGDIFKDGLKFAVDKYMGYAMEELGKGGFLDIALYKYRQRIGGLSFRGRKQWKIMKREFSKKRKESNISPYPIAEVKL